LKIGIRAVSELIHSVMDRAYEGNETRQLVFDLGLDPVVLPLDPWMFLGRYLLCTGR
jgi:hypothetical protein